MISRWVIEAALMGVVLVMLLGAYAGEVREKKLVGRMVREFHVRNQATRRGFQHGLSILRQLPITMNLADPAYIGFRDRVLATALGGIVLGFTSWPGNRVENGVRVWPGPEGKDSFAAAVLGPDAAGGLAVRWAYAPDARAMELRFGADTVAGQAFREARRWYVPDITQEQVWRDPLADLYGHRTVYAVPLVVETEPERKPWGVMCVYASEVNCLPEEDRQFTDFMGTIVELFLAWECFRHLADRKG